MRRARFLLAALAGLFVLLVASVWVLPSVLDWNRYRSTFEALAGLTLGRPVSITGPITFAVLPEPVLTAAGVTVGGEANGGAADPGSLSVAAMRLRVALVPLLAGRVEARELVLREPVLRLPWPLPSTLLSARPAAFIGGFSARIDGGTLAIGTATLTGITATFGTAETGALTAIGTARLLGNAWRFTSRLTSPGADGSTGLDVALDGEGPLAGIGATLAGQVTADGKLAGHVLARGPDLSRLMPGPATRFRAEGSLVAEAGLAEIDDLDVDVGGAAAHGALAWRVGPGERLDVALQASRLDLDGWLPALLHAAPPRMPIGLDLSADVAPLLQGSVRRLRGAFDVALDGTVAVRTVSALVPGDGELVLTGRIAPDATPGVPPDTNAAAPIAYTGHATLRAADLRTTLRWLEPLFPPLSRLPPGLLHRATLSGEVSAAPGRFTATSLAGVVDESHVEGSITLRTVASGRPFSALELVTDRIDLDPWLPTHWPHSQAGLDAELRLSARQGLWQGETIDQPALDAVLDGGTLVVRQLDGSVRGLHVALSGSLAGGRLLDGKLDASTSNAAAVSGLLPPAWRATPALWSGPAALTLTAAGPLDAIATRFGLDLADGRFEAQPTINLSARRWTGSVTLRHPGARRLITALGLMRFLGAGDADWLGEGSLALVAQVAGSPAGITASSFDLTAGALRASGHLALDATGEEPRVTGRIAAETLPLPMPDPRRADPLPLADLHGWQADLHVEAGEILFGLSPALTQAEGNLVLTGGVLHLAGLSAHLGDGVLAGAIALDPTSQPPAATIDATLAKIPITAPLLDAPIDLAGGTASGDIHLSAAGYSPAALLSTLTGTGHLDIAEGTLTGVDLPALRAALVDAVPDAFAATQTRIRAALAGGATPFDTLALDTTIAQGTVTLGTGTLSAPSGNAALTGSAGLTSGALDLRSVVHSAVGDPPPIGLRLTGTVDAPVRVVDLGTLGTWLVEHARAAERRPASTDAAPIKQP